MSFPAALRNRTRALRASRPAFILALLSFLLGTMPMLHAAPSPHREIIAYVFPQDRVLGADEVAARKLTRINYAFANIRNGEVVEGFSHDAENFTILNGLRRDNPALRILVSVGGWTWSGGFSDAALTPRSREKFIASAVHFIERHKLDGIDLDWEYPGQAGNGNTFRPEDKHNFTLLLAELRQRLDREEPRLHRRLYTSIAAGASARYIEHTEMDKVSRYLDTVNLMTYDFYVGGPATGHDAPLFHNPADPKHVSADNAVSLFLEAGVPASKLVLGVPFYGRSWGEVSAANHGLFQPGKAAKGVHFSYPDLPSLLAQGYVRYWDTEAGVPYLYSAQKRVFVTYEDPQSIAGKCRYVREHNLGGVMFWEYFNDTTGILLDAVHAGLSPTLSSASEATDHGNSPAAN